MGLYINWLWQYLVSWWVVLKFITYLLNHFKFLIVVPEKDMVQDLVGPRSKLGVWLDHHRNHVLEFFYSLID